MSIQTIFRTVLLLCLSIPAVADSTLVSEQSAIRFISVKNAAVAEVHQFKNLRGSLDDSGHAEVTIPLVDVETMIPIRNERMRKLFFETDRFPMATISTRVDMALVKALAPGNYTTMTLDLTLDLHGNKQALRAPVTVARLGDELHVTTVEPLVLNVADFQLTEGVERLREIAGLNNISTAVPVTAALVFAR